MTTGIATTQPTPNDRATEFQAVQFMPAFVLPQALLCGLVVPRDQMTAALRWLSDVLPLSYAVDAMQRIATATSWTAAISADVAVILAFTAAALVGGALTLLLLQFRQWPLPYALAGQAWLLKLHAKESGIPYGIALAAAALLVYPHTAWMTAAGH